jgi:ribosomal protein L15
MYTKDILDDVEKKYLSSLSPGRSKELLWMTSTSSALRLAHADSILANQTTIPPSLNQEAEPSISMARKDSEDIKSEGDNDVTNNITEDFHNSVNFQEKKHTQLQPTFSNPHEMLVHNISILNPKLLLWGILINLVAFILHEMFARFMFAVLLMFLNTILIQYWIWYKMYSDGQSKQETFPMRGHNNAEEKVKSAHAAKKLNLQSTDDLSKKIAQELEMKSKAVMESVIEEKQEELSVSKKLIPGSTMSKLHSKESDDSKNSLGEWANADGTTFNVREGPDYSVRKKKAPSDESMYEVVAVDVHSAERKVWHVARYYDLSKLPGGSDTAGEDYVSSSGESLSLPEILVINILCPLYAPGMFTPVVDGEGFMATIFCRLTERSRSALKSGRVTPSMKLFDRFVRESEFDGSMRGRVKFITRVGNLDELSLGAVISGLASRYNSTPCLIHDGEGAYFRGDNYFEMDIDVHRFSALARNALYHIKQRIPQMLGEYAFLIEGRSNDELPEQLLSSVRIVGLEFSGASEFVCVD